MAASAERRTLRFRVPGKVVLSGGYLVCMGEECISVNVDAYATVEAESCTGNPRSAIVELGGQGSVVLGIAGESIVVASAADAAAGKFVRDVVAAFWEVAGASAQLGVNVSVVFGSGFWTGDGTKTGVGSSACIVVALVHSLRVLHRVGHSTPPLCVEVNRRVAPRASGVDVFTCSYGNAIYSTKKHVRIGVDNMLAIVLGSRGMSSSTRDMIALLDRRAGTWGRLAGINARITALVRRSGTLGRSSYALKPLYREYLAELALVSSLVVPDYQHAVLRDTFSVDGVVGCGASGSGGEDCVWCLVCQEDASKVACLWSTRFSYVSVHKTLSPGGLEDMP